MSGCDYSLFKVSVLFILSVLKIAITELSAGYDFIYYLRGTGEGMQHARLSRAVIHLYFKTQNSDSVLCHPGSGCYYRGARSIQLDALTDDLVIQVFLTYDPPSSPQWTAGIKTRFIPDLNRLHFTALEFIVPAGHEERYEPQVLDFLGHK